MSNRQFKSLVVGCGRIGSRFSEEALIPGVFSHAQAWSEHSSSRLVGVCDSDGEEAERAGSRWKCEYFVKIEEALEAVAPDFVSVCTPDQSHLSVMEQLVRCRSIKVIVMEKPLSNSLSEARKIIELADAAGMQIALNYTRRFSPAFEYLQQGAKTRKWGAHYLSRFTYGKGLLHNGSHALDLLRWMFGEIISLRWISNPVVANGERAGDVEVMLEKGRALLQYVPESIATVFEGEFIFEEARWKFEMGGASWRHQEVKSALFSGYNNFVDSETLPDEFVSPLGGCLLRLIDNVIAHVVEKKSLQCSGRDGLVLQEALENVEGG